MPSHRKPRRFLYETCFGKAFHINLIPSLGTGCPWSLLAARFLPIWLPKVPFGVISCANHEKSLICFTWQTFYRAAIISVGGGRETSNLDWIIHNQGFLKNVGHLDRSVPGKDFKRLTGRSRANNLISERNLFGVRGTSTPLPSNFIKIYYRRPEFPPRRRHFHRKPAPTMPGWSMWIQLHRRNFPNRRKLHLLASLTINLRILD